MFHSVVEYCAEHESYKCGYCNKPDTNYSHGMWAHFLTVKDYQDLIDRGWRRSGKYCYKPTMDVTCCPMYTIRCNVLDFKLSNSQKKVLKKFNNFLMGEDLTVKKINDSGRISECSSNMSEDNVRDVHGQEQYLESTKSHRDIDYSILKNIKQNSKNIELHETVTSNEAVIKLEKQALSNTSNSVTPSLSKVVVVEQEINPSLSSNVELWAPICKQVKKGMGPDPNKVVCKKAKQIRMERKFKKLKERGIEVDSLNSELKTKNKQKQVEDFINVPAKETKHKLEIKLVRSCPPSPEFLATFKESHALYVKYQMVIHGDRPEKCSEPKFKDFLVQSPLLMEHKETGPLCGYGSFHQQYWLDEKIIAVGVIDILPKCVSSVYFYYDPQHMKLTPGTYGALREIAFTRSLYNLSPELQYYYMGFYIHTCPKMRYKGNYHPSELLCPETYRWYPIEDCLPKLNATPYSRFDPDLDTVDENYPSARDIHRIPIYLNGEIMLYQTYKMRFRNEERDTEELMQYARLVGAKTAKSLYVVK